jgi:hypothetical protein
MTLNRTMQVFPRVGHNDLLIDMRGYFACLRKWLLTSSS